MKLLSIAGPDVLENQSSYGYLVKGSKVAITVIYMELQNIAVLEVPVGWSFFGGVHKGRSPWGAPSGDREK